MRKHCPSCLRTRRFLATDSHGWVCESCTTVVTVVGQHGSVPIYRTKTPGGTAVEGVGQQMHAWGVQAAASGEETTCDS